MSGKTLGQIGYEAHQATRWPGQEIVPWDHAALRIAQDAWEAAAQAVAACAAGTTAEDDGAAEITRLRRALKALDELFKIDSDPCNPWNQRAMRIIARGLNREGLPEPKPAPELAAAMGETRELRTALRTLADLWDAGSDRDEASATRPNRARLVLEERATTRRQCAADIRKLAGLAT